MSWYIYIITFFSALLITPMVKWLSLKIGAVDKPNNRKVHLKIMPRLGGLAIYLSFLIGFFISGIGSIEESENYRYLYIGLGTLIIVTIGILDDKYEITALFKLIGQLLAAIVVVIIGGLYVTYINIPFFGGVNLGYFSIPISILWIIIIVNAINLIDGLDGLAVGVSTIALITISILAFLQGHVFIGSLSLLLVSSNLGFLFYNFYPAKIFMGDTGSLFLGFMIACLSLMDFKNLTFFSVIVPVSILAIPIADTFFAIVRRIINKKPLYSPDKSHLHHCLLKLGLSHRRSVLVIYLASILSSIAALIFSTNVMWMTILCMTLGLILLEIGVEVTGIISENYKPLINIFKKIKISMERK